MVLAMAATDNDFFENCLPTIIEDGIMLRAQHSVVVMASAVAISLANISMTRLISSLLAIVYLCCTLPAHALDPTRRIAQFHHTAWSTEEGIPADIWSIAQTPDGYLWLGSINGLYRFDGVSVERIAADLLPSPSIHALAVTPSGGLWIGYERPIGIMSLLQDGKVTNYPIDAPTTTSIHSIAIGNDDTVWASTADSILKFDGKRWRAVESDWGTSLGESSGGVWAFGVAGDGVVWSRNQNGMFYLRPGAPRFAEAQGYVGGVASFTRTPDGRLWTTDSARGHLYALPTLDDVSGPVVPSPTSDIPFSEPLRGAILLDRNGSLWFTNSNEGGLRRARTQAQAVSGSSEDGPPDRFTAAEGLSSNVVHALFEDREGNIWVGTNLGLDRFRPADVVTEPGIAAGFRARFVRPAHNAIYAYTGWSNTAARLSDGSESLYRILPNRAPEMLVRNIGRMREMFFDEATGNVWLTTTKGVQKLEEGRLGPPIPLPDGVEGESLYSTVLDNRGSFWISAFRHGVFRQENGAWVKVPVKPARPATGVLSLDPSGDVWVRYGGRSLFRLRGNSVRDFSNDLPDIGDLTVIKHDAYGFLLGGEAGLARFDGRSFFAISASRTPALSVVTGIEQTTDGSMWLFTQGGILRVNAQHMEAALKSPDISLQYELIGPRDGLPGAPYGGVYGSTLATGSDGRVWFTTGLGLVWIDPAKLDRNPLPPPVVIRSITANQRVYDAPTNLELAPGTTNVQIDYTGLSLTIPERNQFRYKLEGVDKDWVDAGDRRQAFYTKLGPGAYTFRVIASNNAGVWNEEGASVSITIAPTFFESIWFGVLCFAGIAALLWSLYRLRLRQVSGRIRDRIEERMAERERIARELHDTLLQGFQGLMLRFQVVMEQIPATHPAHKSMDDVLDRADAVLAEGRDRVLNLRPPKATGGLLESLTAEVEELPASAASKIRISVEGTRRDLHPTILAELTAIGKEALFNAFLHAKAESIEARLVFGPRAFQLKIRDDGIGIAQEVLELGGRDGHFGLVGMRERAERIRSRFLLASRPGAGTEITVTVPARVAYSTVFRLPDLTRRLLKSRA